MQNYVDSEITRFQSRHFRWTSKAFRCMLGQTCPDSCIPKNNSSFNVSSSILSQHIKRQTKDRSTISGEMNKRPCLSIRILISFHVHQPIRLRFSYEYLINFAKLPCKMNENFTICKQLIQYTCFSTRAIKC